MKTQAYGWLAAAVLAAGLNASYHDGGLEWAHRAADRAEHGSAAVLALASGHVGQFLAETRLLSDRFGSDQVASNQIVSDQIESDEVESDQVESDQVVSHQATSDQGMSDQSSAEPAATPSCPWAAAVARAQAKVARTQTSFVKLASLAQLESSARFESMSAREQARLDRMEASRIRIGDQIEARITAQTDRLRATATVLNSVALKTIESPSQCKTIRVRVPRAPMVHIQPPVIHLDLPADPI